MCVSVTILSQTPILLSICPQTHLGCGVVDQLLSGEVTLVAHQQLVDILVGIAIDLLEPLLYVVVRLLSIKKE